MSKNKLLSLSPYRVFPPNSGGKQRIFNINRGFAVNGWDVFQFSGSTVLKPDGKLLLKSQAKEVYPGYQEYCYFNPIVQLSNRYIAMLGVPLMAFDYYANWFFKPDIIKKQMSESQFVMLEHPYLVSALQPYINTKKHTVVLNAHNIESVIYSLSGKESFLKEKVIKRLMNVEKKAFEIADIIFVCSEEDKNKAIELFDTPKEKIFLAPNGVDSDAYSVATPEEKKSAKQRIGFKHNSLVIFIGSDWAPNTEAVKEMIKMSPQLEDGVQFVVIGGVGNRFMDQQSDKIHFTGFVDRIDDYLIAADLAINPMKSGSGSNIKMFEYMAAGVPVISSDFGARGLLPIDENKLIRSSIEDMPKTITSSLNNKDLSHIAVEARNAAVDRYDWVSISKTMTEVILAHGQ